MSTIDRKSREKEQRKTAIIDAAEKIFTQNGYEKTTIDDIAKESELAKGTLYLYFQSKEEIFGGIILRGLETMASLLEEQQKTASTGIEKYDAANQVFQDYCKKFSDYLKILALYQSQHFLQFIKERGPIVQEIENKKQAIVRNLTQAIQTGIQDGSIDKSINAEKTAMIIITTAASFTHPHKMHSGNQAECDQNTEELMKYFFELMRTAIKAK